MDPTNLPINLEAGVTFRHETKKLILRIERDEFKVCEPIRIEKSGWFNLRRKVVLVHRTADGKWDIATV